MDKKDNDIERGDMGELLSKVVYKTPPNSHMKEIGEALALKRSVIRRRERFRYRFLRWGIASSVAVICALSSLTYFSEIDYQSGSLELACSLPDGSQVIVMPNSSLSYNRFTWVLRRRAVLAGEAFFTVTQGRRFSVTTRAGEVVVLGTRFRVWQHRDELLVECYEGSVLVTTPVGEELLMPGRKVECDRFRLTISELAESLPPLISFNAVPLEEVIRSIEHVFGVSVHGEEKYRDLVFTGFIITSDRDETLEAVFRSCGISYEISANDIILDR